MSRRGGIARRAALVGSALLGPILLGGSVQADPGIDIDHVDVTEGQVSLLLGVDRLPAGHRPTPGTVSVLVDRDPVEATVQPVAASEVVRTSVLVLDASRSMGVDGIREAQAAARAFLEAAPSDVRIGLITFAGRVRDVVAPTTEHDALVETLENLRRSGGTRAYDALAAAVDLMDDEGAGSVVLLSDGEDQGSDRTADDVVELVTARSVVVDVVAFDQAPRERRVLGRIAETSGGTVVPAAEPGALRALFTREARALSRQLVVRFTPPAHAEGEVVVDVTFVAGGRTYEDSALVALPTSATQPSGTAAGSSILWAGGSAVLIGGASAIGVGLALLTWIILVSRPQGPGVDRRLATYFGESAAAPPLGLRTSAVAVAQVLVPKDVEARLARRLGGAGLDLRPAEWVLLCSAVAVVPGLVGLVFGGPLTMVLLLAAGVLSPVLYLRIRHGRRLAAFGAQQPETLSMLANSLSAGLSVVQAIDTVVRDGQEPMAGELRRALLEQRLGVGIEDALEGVAARMDSKDFAWSVMAIRIQREVGGNLSEVLLTVSETLRERELVRRQVRTLSAEGRLSAWILGGLPVAMFGYLLVANRDFVRPLYTEFLGGLMLGAAVLLLVTGSWFMSRLVKVEV